MEFSPKVPYQFPVLLQVTRDSVVSVTLASQLPFRRQVVHVRQGVPPLDQPLPQAHTQTFLGYTCVSLLTSMRTIVGEDINVSANGRETSQERLSVPLRTGFGNRDGRSKVVINLSEA